MGGGPARS